MTSQPDSATLVPTVANVDLTFPIAVLGMDDAARLADARLVVLIADEPDSGCGVPLTVHGQPPYPRRGCAGVEPGGLHPPPDPEGSG